MKKVLLAAGVAGLMVFGAIGCGSTCCSKTTSANCATGQCAPGTPGAPVTASSGMIGTSQPTTMPLSPTGRPMVPASPTTTTGTPANPMLIPQQ